ncbi:MAG: insulinase family protein [Clostridiales bacterium]|nr:insulinase family protein [Clostridiales bacterium]
MEPKIINFKNNIDIHYLKDNKYKTNFISVILTVPLNRETVTTNALIPAVLRRGTKRLDSMKKLEIEMEEMYGASLDCGLDKAGKNHVLKFYIETAKDEMVGENLFEKAIQNISEIILNPYLENGLFKEEYVVQEKKTLEILINDKINDKTSYARVRCIEEMFNNKDYGIYVYGYTDDLNKITNEMLYNQYVNILKTAKIDIFVYTNESEDNVKELFHKYFSNSYLEERKIIYNVENCFPTIKEKENIVNESLDINQGKLVIGATIENENEFTPYQKTIANAVLGVGANSKMFRYVREKEHLAYSAASSYIRNANTILIFAGIELNNYDKAVTVIKKQIDNMKKGEITAKELQDAKSVIINSYKTLFDEQYRIINYYINQCLSNSNVNIEETIKEIENVKMEDVIKVANSIKIDTIYYLKK